MQRKRIGGETPEATARRGANRKTKKSKSGLAQRKRYEISNTTFFKYFWVNFIQTNNATFSFT